MQKKAFKKSINRNKMMKAAAQVATRTQNQDVATNLMHDAADGQILKREANTLVKEVLGLNYMTVSGRPSSIQMNASVKLGASQMTPNQVRDVLKSGKMKTVQDENAHKA